MSVEVDSRELVFHEFKIVVKNILARQAASQKLHPRPFRTSS